MPLRKTPRDEPRTRIIHCDHDDGSTSNEEWAVCYVCGEDVMRIRRGMDLGDADLRAIRCEKHIGMDRQE